MLPSRELIAFFAGVESFHTLSHILFRYSGTLPVKVFGITWSQQLNTFAILANAVITALLFWWLL